MDGTFAGRRPRTALHDPPRQERTARQRRPGRHRRRGGQADGLRSALDPVHPSRSRARPGLRRRARDRDSGRCRRRRGALEFRRALPQDDLRVAGAAPHLLGAPQEAPRVVPQDLPRALVLPRERRLSRHVLVQLRGEEADGRGAAERVGVACSATGSGSSPTSGATRRWGRGPRPSIAPGFVPSSSPSASSPPASARRPSSMRGAAAQSPVPAPARKPRCGSGARGTPCPRR